MASRAPTFALGRHERICAHAGNGGLLGAERRAARWALPQPHCHRVHARRSARTSIRTDSSSRRSTPTAATRASSIRAPWMSTDAVRATFGAETERSQFTTASFGGPADARRGAHQQRLRGAACQAAHGPHDDDRRASRRSRRVRRQDHHRRERCVDAERGQHGAARELQRRLQGADAVPAAERLRQRAAAAGDRARLGCRHHAAPVRAARWSSAPRCFRRDSHDLINFVSCVAPFTGICASRPNGTYDNVARARAEGVELTRVLRPLEALSRAGELHACGCGGSFPRQRHFRQGPGASSGRDGERDRGLSLAVRTRDGR